MPAMNKVMVFAGVATLFQAGAQMLITALALFQYFCIIDFLVELPLLVFIRILYFHNPSTCGLTVNIGQVIDGMAGQAFVLLTREPFTVTRTFIINTVSLGLSILWLLSCIGLMRGGAKNVRSKPVRWPWIVVTVAVCSLDIVATVTYANDTFHTRTLSDMMDFIGGIASGTGNQEVDTTWASWLMVIIYSRFVIIFLLNLILIVLVIIDSSKSRLVESTAVQVEAPAVVTTVNANTSVSDKEEEDVISLPSESPTKLLPRPGLRQSFRLMKAQLFREPSPVARSLPNSLDASPERSNFNMLSESGLPSKTPAKILPRAGLSQSFQRMKARLFKEPSPIVQQSSLPNSLDPSPERSPRPQHVEVDKKRQVNFPENLLSLPQRLENLIAEQQRRLDRAVIDTAGRHSPPRASQSMPQLASTSAQDIARGRRGTAAELQGQLPWAYIPASGHPMRDQLPPDEDLPPVPLPDYTAIPSFRKASVHRATSSLSSLTQKKDYKSQVPRPPLTQSDVLY